MADAALPLLVDTHIAALRRELTQLGDLVERAVQQVAAAAAASAVVKESAAAAPAQAPAPPLAPHDPDELAVTAASVPEDKSPKATTHDPEPGRHPDNDNDCPGRFLGDPPLRREDFRRALDEWWAEVSARNGLAGIRVGGSTGAPLFDAEKGAAHERRGGEVLKRQASPSTSGGGTRSQSTESYENSTPPASPFSLPPALVLSTSETLSMPTPLYSPSSGPISCPATPLMHFAMNPPLSATNARKDWRRSFVEKAFKANRKIEFIHGTQCRETSEVHDAMEEAIVALEEGIAPHLVEDGLGGTYFLKDRDGANLAVFKPRDEEPLAPNNPKVHAGEGRGMGLKEGVLVGDASINEYAAFLLDQASSCALRAGVCPTALVRVANSVFHSAKERRHSAFRVIKDKVGSFQLFAQHDCTSEDMGPGRYPDNQVHRIAVLDIRVCNTDRHSGNILVREEEDGQTKLIPIDHGYALPGEVGGATFEWLSWPAARRPFSEEMKRDIAAIDPEAVEEALRRKVPALRDESLATLRTCTTLLQCGVEAGLTAYDIGSMMTRPDDEVEFQRADSEDVLPTHTPSVLESLIRSAKRKLKVANAAGEEPEPFDVILEGLIREKCEEIAGREA